MPVSGGAQPVSALTDLWMRVKSGDSVFITDASGRETAGTFARVSDSALSLMVDGQLRDLPAADVREISKRGDSVKNGFLIGAAIGATVGAAAYSSCDDIYEGECMHPAGAALMGGLVYGGIGALIDHFVKGRTVVFRVRGASVQLRPNIAADRGAVRLSISVPLSRWSP
jgi:hypothetical protein